MAHNFQSLDPGGYMRNVKKLLYTTLSLTATGLIMRTVGVWFNVYLTNLIGTKGIGIFQLILSVYAMAKTLAYAGMTLGATRLCIDDFVTARHSVRRVMVCALIMGCFAGVILYCSSPFLSDVWMKAPDATDSLRVLSYSLPFVSMSAGLNGYMTAARKLGRYSLIQLMEQLCRIITTILLISNLSMTGQREMMLFVSCGITISELFSFSLCLISYLYDIKKHTMKKTGKKGFLKRFCRIAVPDAIGAYVRSGLNTVEHLLIPWGIRRSGISTEESFSAYGIVQGMALPVLLYPAAILGVVSSLLVPEIAECKLKKNHKEIAYIINRVLKITSIFSTAIAVIVFLYAETISRAIFHTGESAPFLRILAPLIPVMYMDMTTDGMLKGLDQQLSLMRINVLDSLLCVALVYFLVPKAAVNGYIVTIYTAEIINFILSFFKLRRNTTLSIRPFRHVLLPVFIATICFKAPSLFIEGIKKPVPEIIAVCGIGFILYLLVLRLTGCVTKEDANWAKQLLTPSLSSSSRSEASRPRFSSAFAPGSKEERTRRISHSPDHERA